MVFTRRALSDLERLDSEIKKRIAIKLSRKELGSYRFRIGDYRVIFDTDSDTIVVLRLGHRREIYR
ncbi:type II toxin-antitoxin system RelE/ParE family toxin [bacterium]|nr:type II toxin-antitoxin system RelE/ParE family toxin [bacterium]